MVVKRKDKTEDRPTEQVTVKPKFRPVKLIRQGVEKIRQFSDQEKQEMTGKTKEEKKQYRKEKRQELWEKTKEKIRLDYDTNVKETSEDKSQLFKIEKVTSSWVILIPLSILIFFLCFLGIQYLANVITNCFTRLPAAMDGHTSLRHVYGISQAFRPMRPGILILVDLLISWLAQGKFIWNVRTNYKDNNIGQKGTARWTTLREIQQQYKEIPEKATSTQTYYKGGGGVPVCRYKDKIYIDDSPVNNLIIGITRSGKGEMFVFPMIDIYSRAGADNPQKRASIIATDPKLELYANSFDTLTKRGYKVCCLNLVEPLKSMGYNPLQMIINAYKEENYDDAEMLANTFAYSIFSPGSGGGDNEFWDTESANLLVALILAHIDDCLKEDQYVNVKRLEEFREKQKKWDALTDDEQQEIRDKIKSVEAHAKKQKARWEKKIKRRKEAEQAFSDAKTDEEKLAAKDALDRIPRVNENRPREAYDEIIRDFRQEGIYELDAIPPDMEFTPSDKYERMITMYSIVNTFTELGRLTNSEDGSSALDDYFAVRPVGDRGKLKYSAIEVAGDQTKGSIFASCLAKLTIFTYNDIAKMTARTEFELADVGFGDQPIAIFLGIPDYDQSNHFIASVFIRQLYFILAKKATEAGGKCKREVIFLLDEFGNLPAIDSMSNIITVCLGRNIRFDLVVQSYAQVEKLYDKDAETIIGNCGNKIYILTNDNQTAENYSQSLGNKTIMTVSRSGGKLSQNKSFTEAQEERPLLNSNELMQLQPGECVVVRTMKRQDKHYNNVPPTPIFNHGDTKFKYRFQYLADDFTDGKTVDDVAYDETVQNTRIGDITFDIYHFCEDVMRPYMEDKRRKKDKNSGNDGKDKDNKPQEETEEWKRYDMHVKESGGVDYTNRHSLDALKKQKLSALYREQQHAVYLIMRPFISGMQESDPLFQNYTFYDCLWKTYLAYRNGTINAPYDEDEEDEADVDVSSASGAGTDKSAKEVFEEKFDSLLGIFRAQDSEYADQELIEMKHLMDEIGPKNRKTAESSAAVPNLSRGA